MIRSTRIYPAAQQSIQAGVVFIALALFACFSLAGCGMSRVDPISPDIHGVEVNRPQSIGGDYYYFERRDPTTRKWYGARELIPGFGQMIYTERGKQQLQKDKETPK